MKKKKSLSKSHSLFALAKISLISVYIVNLILVTTVFHPVESRPLPRDEDVKDQREELELIKRGGKGMDRHLFAGAAAATLAMTTAILSLTANAVKASDQNQYGVSRKGGALLPPSTTTPSPPVAAAQPAPQAIPAAPPPQVPLPAPVVTNGTYMNPAAQSAVATRIAPAVPQYGMHVPQITVTAPQVLPEASHVLHSAMAARGETDEPPAPIWNGNLTIINNFYSKRGTLQHRPEDEDKEILKKRALPPKKPTKRTEIPPPTKASDSDPSRLPPAVPPPPGAPPPLSARPPAGPPAAPKKGFHRLDRYAPVAERVEDWGKMAAGVGALSAAGVMTYSAFMAHYAYRAKAQAGTQAPAAPAPAPTTTPVPAAPSAPAPAPAASTTTASDNINSYPYPQIILVPIQGH